MRIITVEMVQYTNVELLNEVGSHFDNLWKLHLFMDCVISPVWDEGHFLDDFKC